LADDLGYGDVGVYGATEIRTPNIDILAQGGTRFTSFYSNSAVCCPTRAAFLTGRYSNRVGIDNVITLQDPQAPTELRRAKLHLPRNSLKLLVTQPHLWVNGIWDIYLATIRLYTALIHFSDWHIQITTMKARFIDRNTEIIEQETDQTLLTHRFTQEALDFIDLNKPNLSFISGVYRSSCTALCAPGFCR
jgi:arylsulfatase